MGEKRLDYILEGLRSGAFVLTVNARLYRFIKGEYDKAMASEGKLLWNIPSVITFSSWLKSVWESACPELPVLDDTRKGVIWEGIIARSKFLPEDVIASEGIASTASKAYSIIKEYGINLSGNWLHSTQESRAMKGWAEEYEKKIADFRFVDESSLAELVAGLIEKKEAVIPEKIILGGFDELTPSLDRIISASKAAGVMVDLWPVEPARPGHDISLGQGGTVNIRPCEDETEEAIQAARWIRSIFSPGIKVGVIVPDLARYRDIIKREFRSELTPSFIMPSGDRDDAFNISLGLSLYDDPLVRSAVDILSIGKGKVELSRLSPVLLSPYFAGGECLMLPSMEFRLRKKNRLRIRIEELPGLIGDGDTGQRLSNWVKSLKEAPAKDYPSAWARRSSALLEGCGWLSGVKLSSSEYQVLSAWNGVLECLAGLDDLLGKITRAEAVSRISVIARARMHQPESPDSQVQVLGLLESAGLSFDKVWVMGCHEYALPGQPSPNPFIPVELQRKHFVPHSSHDRELAFAKMSLNHVLASSPDITVSYPVMYDQKETRLSPVLRGAGSETVIEEGLPSSRLCDAMRGASLEPVPPDGPVPVSSAEIPFISGGTTIIKDQSQCPFRAFAAHRLKAMGLPEPDFGLTAGERGTILHEAMRVFWEDMKDSERLQELINKGGLDPFIKTVVNGIFSKIAPPDPLSSRFMEIEKERLASLIREWAAVEAARGPFRVKMTEKEIDLEIKGLRISGRLDRVDETDTGEVILDYKTGREVNADWLSKRPKDPQLLIYSLAGRFDAISFARVLPGECRFIGVSRTEALPGVKQSDLAQEVENTGGWEGLMNFWRGVVEGLAVEFMEGENRVDPIGWPSQSGACRYCDMGPLCRINQAGTVSAEGEDDDN